MKREKSVFEVARLLQEYLEEAGKELGRYEKEGNPEDLETAKKILEKVKKADLEEIERIQEKVEDREAEKECRELWKGVEKAEEHLEEGNVDEVVEYLKRLFELTQSIYGDVSEYDLTQDYKKGEFLGDGRNAEVYTLESHDGLVMKMIHDDEMASPAGELKKFHKYMKIEQGLPNDVRIARIKEIGYYGDSAGIIMEKAPGKEVHRSPESGEERVVYQRWSKMNEQIAQAPQKHYRELAYTVKQLRKHNLQVDPKTDNIFYHPDRGFTIIDIGMSRILNGGKSRYTPCLLRTLGGIKFKVSGGKMYFDENRIDHEDIRNINQIDRNLREINYAPSDKKLLEDTREKIKILESNI